MLLHFISLLGRASRALSVPADKIFAIVFLLALASALMLWWRWPTVFRGLLLRVKACSRLLTRRNAWAFAVVALIPLTLRILTLPVRPIPLPRVHDEFSYLLAGDTFAHGRMTNPPHALWQSFESFHILQQPSYMSMYPPAQGLALAIGQVLFGHPWWGVFFSFGIMCSLTFWACRGWFSGGWALFGAILTGLEFGSGYWLNSYWGGAVAAIGGCLVIGSVGRIWGVRGAHVRVRGQGIWLGLGFAILANSRPWEGFWLTLGIGLVLIYRWASTRKDDDRRRISQAAAPCCVVLLLAGLFMAYYDWRVTGKPFQLPHMLNRATYAVAPMFIWQTPAAPKEYRYEVMRRFYLEWEPTVERAASYSTLHGFVRGVISRGHLIQSFLFGTGFTVLVLLFGWRSLCHVNFSILPVCLGIFTLGFVLQRYYFSHYLAPLVGLAALIKLFSLRHLYCLRWRRLRVGLALAPAFMVGALAAGLVGWWLPTLLLRRAPPVLDDFRVTRFELQQRLLRTPGRHVVLVRYSPTHAYHEEWVYNGEAIDSSDVVWARYYSTEQNCKLMKYFSDRSVWLLEADLYPAPTALALLRRGSVAADAAFYPRRIYPYWRESWLEGVGSHIAGTGEAGKAIETDRMRILPTVAAECATSDVSNKH